MASDFCITLIGIGVSCGMTSSASLSERLPFPMVPGCCPPPQLIALSGRVLHIRGNNADDGNQNPSDSLHSPIPRQFLLPEVG
jgi:hypothetical protein